MYFSIFKDYVTIIGYYQLKFGQFDHKKSSKDKRIGTDGVVDTRSIIPGSHRIISRYKQIYP